MLSSNQGYALTLSFLLGFVGWLQLILLIRPHETLASILTHRGNWFGLPFGISISILYWARLVFVTRE
jgi:hypothetical protein